MTAWDEIEKLILVWIYSLDKLLKINKVTRAGVTTGFVKLALEGGFKIAVIAPYNMILDETIPEAVRLAGLNADAYRIIRKNEVMCPEYKKGGLFDWPTKGNCSKCKNNACKYNELKAAWNAGTCKCVGITYDKYRAMSANSHISDLSVELLNIVMGCDIILCDEIVHTYKNSKTFDAKALLGAFDRVYSDNVMKILTELSHEFAALDGTLREMVENKKLYHILANRNDELNYFDVMDYGNKLIGFMKEGEKENFRRYLLALMGQEMVIVKSKGTQFHPKRETVKMAAKKDTFIGTFLWEQRKRNCDPKVIITGAIIPDTKDIIGVKGVEMPDFNKTESQQLIVTDHANWNFSAKDWKRNQEKVKKIIDLLQVKFPDDSILVIAFNKKIANDIKRWYPHLRIIHYRGEGTIGVELRDKNNEPYRRAVVVGMPWTPEEANEENDLMYGEKRGTIRKYDQWDNFKNPVGRIKDSKGSERSIAFILGGDLKTVNEFFPGKKEVVETHKSSTLQDVAAPLVSMWLAPGKAEYKDIKVLPLVAEALNYPSGTYTLKTFADDNLKIPTVKFKKLFDKYRHLFPKHWKIYRKGRGYIIET